MAPTKNCSGNKITEGVIWRQLLIFFFPILLGTFFQQLYNTVDAVVVGRFVGKEALAAVGGSTSTLINFFVNFFVGLSSGATVTISQYYGAKDDEDTSRAVHTAIALALLAGAFMTIVCVSGASWALTKMGTTPEVMPHAVQYLRVYMAGVVFQLLFNIGSAILRAVGDSRRPLYLLVVCTIVNIVLDLYFTISLGWGVLGVAVATIGSQFVSAALVWYMLASTSDVYKLTFRKIRIDFRILRRIVRIGLPAGLQSIMYTSSNIIIQSTINSFGVDTVAAWATFGKIDSIYWTALSALSVSITTFSGQNFGAQKYDRIKSSVNASVGIATVITLIVDAAVLTWGREMLEFFTPDPGVTKIGLTMISGMVPYYFTYIYVDVLAGAVRGTGDSLIPMLMTSVGICVFRVFWIWQIFPHWQTLSTIVYSYPISWALTSVFFMIYYYHGGWLKRRIALSEFEKHG